MKKTIFDLKVTGKSTDLPRISPQGRGNNVLGEWV